MSSGAIIAASLPEKPTPLVLSRLTPRQRAVLALLAEGKTPSEITEELGVSKQAVHQLIEASKGRIADLMDNLGLGDAALVSRYLKPALTAEKTEFFQNKGKVTDQRNTVAWGPRLQALDIAAKMRGMYSKESSVTVDNKIMVVVRNIGED